MLWEHSLESQVTRQYFLSTYIRISAILQRTIALPCLIPFALNSIVLTASTIILLFMRNHLFIWSVFSPKYLYACAATLSGMLGYAW
ncbi:hypothetical protein J5N97_000344 [Dioscorea zingiberensis]|uniref:GPI ethanolamine phosphate transferase 2 C-terminal domain-containing protein n=1 Tax=Dioscorea zingiberensis TaxID=325984 RepID=A0A9D5BSR2_9LILI|nr:hypothetical protein J5N97_000344 [Dioscorea zingiberensis]